MAPWRPSQAAPSWSPLRARCVHHLLCCHPCGCYNILCCCHAGALPSAGLNACATLAFCCDSHIQVYLLPDWAVLSSTGSMQRVLPDFCNVTCFKCSASWVWQVNQVLNKARDDAGNYAQGSLPDTNNVVRMVTAGSKGSFINISQANPFSMPAHVCILLPDMCVGCSF